MKKAAVTSQTSKVRECLIGSQVSYQCYAKINIPISHWMSC